MSEGIIFTDLDALTRALAQLTGPEIEQIGERIGFKVGLNTENELKVNPKTPNYPLKWASRKQRAWYFAMRVKDGLPIKYTRGSDPWSHRSTDKWVTKSIRGGAIVGNPVPYTPYTQSTELQTEMHRDTGWTTDRQAVDKVFRSGEVGRVVQQEVAAAVKRAFRGLT
jgi:hypothetical protein